MVRRHPIRSPHATIVVGSSASPEEAAAIAAASIEFIRASREAAGAGPSLVGDEGPCAWTRAALLEGVDRAPGPPS